MIICKCKLNYQLESIVDTILNDTYNNSKNKMNAIIPIPETKNRIQALIARNNVILKITSLEMQNNIIAWKVI